jgi:hypothetical protein
MRVDEKNFWTVIFFVLTIQSSLLVPDTSTTILSLLDASVEVLCFIFSSLFLREEYLLHSSINVKEQYCECVVCFTKVISLFNFENHLNI